MHLGNLCLLSFAFSLMSFPQTLRPSDPRTERSDMTARQLKTGRHFSYLCQPEISINGLGQQRVTPFWQLRSA
jgi:hypothetical protein